MIECKQQAVSLKSLVQSHWLLRLLNKPLIDWPYFDIVLALLSGAGIGALMVVANGLSTKWKGLLLIMVPGFTLVMLIKDLKRFLLAMMFLAVPINLDVSVVISPYSEKLVALTELRVSLVTFLLIVGYALWIIEKPWQNQFNKTHFLGEISWPALGVILSLIVAAPRATNLQLSLFQIVQYIELFLTYFYIANHIRNEDDVNFVLRIILLGLMVESLMMVLQWTTGIQFNFAGVDAAIYTPGTSGMQSRVGGTVGGPNGAGAYLAAHLPLAAVLVFASPHPWEKTFAAVTLCLGCIAIVGTFSRSAWAGLITALTLFAALGIWRGWIKVGQVALVACGFMVLVGLMYRPISLRLTGDDHGSADSRVQLKSLAWEIIKANPIWGVGTNNYAVTARHYISPRQVNMDLPTLRTQPVHNTYMLVWAERGVIGLVIWATFYLSILKHAFLAAKYGERSTSLTAGGLLGGFIAIAVRMYGQHGIGRVVNLYFWLFTAVVASLMKLTRQETARRQQLSVANLSTAD